MKRATCVVTSSLLVCLSCAIGDARAELVRRAVCAKVDATREIELRSIDGVSGVCEVVERVAGESTEERTPYSDGARYPLCRTRFDEAVGSLTEAGWRCSLETGAGARLDAGSAAETWWVACVAAQSAKGVADAERLCDCAVGVMDDGGVDERTFEALLSPDDETEVARPGLRSGLSQGVGMVAVDAMVRCGTP